MDEGVEKDKGKCIMTSPMKSVEDYTSSFQASKKQSNKESAVIATVGDYQYW